MQQRARHVGAQHQQFGHARRGDGIAIHLAIDFKGRYRAQDRRPEIEIELGFLAQALARRHAGAGIVKLDVEQARSVIAAFNESADAHEIERFIP